MIEPWVAPEGFQLSDLDDGPREKYEGPMKHVISVTELEELCDSHKGCPRKWGLMRLQKCPKIPGEALIDGVFIHRCVQERHDWPEAQWIAKWQTGTKSPTGKEYWWYAQLALSIIRHVSEHEWANGVSEATAFLEIPELNVAVYIKPDFLNWKKFRDWKSTAAQVKTSEWVLQDPEWWKAKTMSSLHFTLVNNIQARVYAHGLMSLMQWDVIDAEWTYGCKKFGRGQRVKTWVCPARFERDETRAWVEKHVYPLIEFAVGVKEAWAEKQFDSVHVLPHNPKVCEFRGKFCDAYGHCKLIKSPIALQSLHLPVIPA